MSRLDEAHDQIHELEDKVEKVTQKEQEKEKKRLSKNEQLVKELQDNMKHNNICTIKDTRRRRRRGKDRKPV